MRKNTLYDWKWRKAKHEHLTTNHRCVDCGGIATDVDHDKPHKGDIRLFWDKSNWRSRCHSCHSKKTASQDGGFGNKYGSARASGACDKNGMPIDSRHPWNQEKV